jgi:hypothetical protein
LPSTPWGGPSCPDRVHSGGRSRSLVPGQPPVDSWTTPLHRLWTTAPSTGPPGRCPPAAHRLWAVVPSFARLLHSAVHCSATQRALSPGRVKGVTSRRPRGLWATWVNLGTPLGRSGSALCIGCAELSPVHRNPRLSTGSAHRRGGQNSCSELRKRGYPRFPQALLLPPLRESREFVSKWGLCTTRGSRRHGAPERGGMT